MPYVSIAAVLAYVFFYGVGLGPIPYFIASGIKLFRSYSTDIKLKSIFAELFSVGPRPAGMALGSMANWGANFVVGMTFPSMQSAIGAFSFLPFATSTALLGLLLWRKLPETFGVDPSEPETNSEEIALKTESPKEETDSSIIS
jgi:MFS transporter, SP family, solute carrier family 2 (facilitated glucose transporter), member 3